MRGGRGRGSRWSSRGRQRDILRLFKARKAPLIEFSAFRDNCTLRERVVKFPALVALRIANKDAFLHVRRQPFAFVLLDMHIRSAAPNAQVRDVRLPSMPQLVGRRIWTHRGEGVVEDVHQRENSLPQNV